MILDAHQHFWQYDPVRDSWIDDNMAVLRHDYMPQDLELLLQKQGIDGCVAVQADQSETETHFLLNLAAEHPFVKAVVGWVDLRAENVVSRLDYFSQFRLLKGFRHIVQGEPDVNFMLRPDFLGGVAALQHYGFAYDVLVFPHQLGAALELVRRFPQQRFVLDHAGKPYIKNGYFDGWAAMIEALSLCDNLWCKWSGLTTEADWQHWTPDDLTRYNDHLLETFGPNRLMYGSDWPVCLLAGDYATTRSVVSNHIMALSLSEQQQIMGLNAQHFYQIPN